MADKPFLAFDIGAASGRAILGYISRGSLKLSEIHRFEIRPVMLGGRLYWDFLFIWQNILESLKKCAAAGVKDLAGIGIDTFNCDFGLLDRSGTLIGNPVSYRDTSPAAVKEQILNVIDEESLFRESGFGFSAIAGLSRLVFLDKESAGLLFRTAAQYLALPDLIRFFLTRNAQGEETILWGSQLLDIRTRGWNKKLMGLFRLPGDMFPPVVPPGTFAGELLQEVKGYANIDSAPVFVVAGHDTISSTLSVFDAREDTAFLATGSWFVLGALLKEPETGLSAFRRGFVNEIGVNSIFFAKNMMGFYVLEGLINTWKLTSIDCTYESLIRESIGQPPFSMELDVNDPVFFSSVNMNATVLEYLRNTGQEASAERGKIVRSIFENLASSCAAAVSELGDMTGRNINQLVVFGGVVKNAFLCQMIADAAGITVVTGPAEAAAAGNIGMQMLAAGAVGSAGDLDKFIKGSFAGGVYNPEN